MKILKKRRGMAKLLTAMYARSAMTLGSVPNAVHAPKFTATETSGVLLTWIRLTM
jgi:hypothetical protein